MKRLLCALCLCSISGWALQVEKEDVLQEQIKQLAVSLQSTSVSLPPQECLHLISEILEEGKYVLLEDGSLWLMGRSYREVTRSWHPRERVRISSHPNYFNNVAFHNIDKKSTAWGVNETRPEGHLNPFIFRFANSIFDSAQEFKMILSNGLILQGPSVTWKQREPIFIFGNASGVGFDLWNLFRNEISRGWHCLGNEKEGSGESILTIENRLNASVLGQEEAVRSIAQTLFNCSTGLHDPQKPIGVFLFLGPTGVGKTELAKALTQQLYKNPNHLIRLDMSQYTTEYLLTRLIGTPPGYKGYEEGGHLTEALKKYPRSIVLLDEIEKAHPTVQKFFLPVCDEGYIVDMHNIKVSCQHVIFIMTGNLCSQEIADLFNQGYEADEVLQKIEPAVIRALSPELYNRMTPIVFRPISRDLMYRLVDQKIKGIQERLKSQRGIDLQLDATAKSYLVTHGFHPTLGVRPLQRVIEKVVVGSVSHAIIKEGIPEGSTLELSYVEAENIWNITWFHPRA